MKCGLNSHWSSWILLCRCCMFGLSFYRLKFWLACSFLPGEAAETKLKSRMKERASLILEHGRYLDVLDLFLYSYRKKKALLTQN